MALKTLMLRKSLDEKRSALDALMREKESLRTREAEMETEIAEANDAEKQAEVAEKVNAFEADKTALGEKEETLRSEIEALESELEAEERKDPAHDAKKEIRKVEEKMDTMEVRASKEYVDAYANYIKTNKADQCRALLTINADDGVVPVPTIVDSIVRTAWERNELMNYVRKTYLKGNVQVGFEISADPAVIHEEGDEAPDEEDLVLGIVTMVPQSIKKWITVSDEALDLNGEEFLRYVYDEITYQIAKLAASTLIGKITAASTSSSATAVGVAKITEAPALGTVANAIAALSDEATNPVIVMNKSTWAYFKGIQYEGNYAVDPFEGLPVVFNNALPAYSAASDNAVYMIVGDFQHGAQANFPNGDTIRLKYDDLSLAEADLVKIVGREFVGLGVVAPFAFTNVAKPAASEGEGGDGTV